MKNKNESGSLNGHATLTMASAQFQPNSCGTSVTIDSWGWPERLEVNEYDDQIEMVYKETSNMVYTVFPARPQEVRVFKIIFSVVDGKWNKSERIYGKIIPKSKESYEFED